MDLHITLVGLNHRTAGVDVRERFALADCARPENWALPCGDNVNESFILSTCNRVELLAVGVANPESELLERWGQACQSEIADLRRYVYIHKNLDAARHVFEVASSLDSMVLGEPQILGQMKAAYRNAVESHCAGPILNRLMHNAFTVAKRVRHETAVAASAVSISYAAVELAKRIFGAMPSHRAMLIGAGEMAELAATHLLQAGIDEIIVVNRTLQNGEALAQKFHGRAIGFDRLQEGLAQVDIVIASTGSKDPILNAANVKIALKARKNRPMFFIDIAVPRDIDPDVNTIDNVYLYDIDDLKDVVEENMAGRREEAARARLIIDEEVARFAAWLNNLDAKPTILDLIKRGEDVASIEVEHALKRLGSTDPAMRAALEGLARGLVNKLNHAPLMYLKRGGMGRDDPHGRISTIRRIFNLDHPNSSQASKA